jgi:antitoxin StbD
MTNSKTYIKVMNMPLLASQGVSISELKKNPTAVIEAAEGGPVAILNRNRPAAYLIPAEAWENIMERLEDIELAEIVRQRESEIGIPVNIDDL